MTRNIVFCPSTEIFIERRGSPRLCWQIKDYVAGRQFILRVENLHSASQVKIDCTVAQSLAITTLSCRMTMSWTWMKWDIWSSSILIEWASRQPPYRRRYSPPIQSSFAHLKSHKPQYMSHIWVWGLAVEVWYLKPRRWFKNWQGPPSAT